MLSHIKDNIKAIHDFDPAKGKFLFLEGTGTANERLITKQLGFLGRVWLWICTKIGCSNASMAKLANYIADQGKNLLSELTPGDYKRLAGKVLKYDKRHPNKITYAACVIKNFKPFSLPLQQPSGLLAPQPQNVSLPLLPQSVIFSYPQTSASSSAKPTPNQDPSPNSDLEEELMQVMKSSAASMGSLATILPSNAPKKDPCTSRLDDGLSGISPLLSIISEFGGMEGLKGIQDANEEMDLPIVIEPFVKPHKTNIKALNELMRLIFPIIVASPDTYTRYDEPVPIASRGLIADFYIVREKLKQLIASGECVEFQSKLIALETMFDLIFNTIDPLNPDENQMLYELKKYLVYETLGLILVSMPKDADEILTVNQIDLEKKINEKFPFLKHPNFRANPDLEKDVHSTGMSIAAAGKIFSEEPNLNYIICGSSKKETRYDVFVRTQKGGIEQLVIDAYSSMTTALGLTIPSGQIIASLNAFLPKPQIVPIFSKNNMGYTSYYSHPFFHANTTFEQAKAILNGKSKGSYVLVSSKVRVYIAVNHGAKVAFYEIINSRPHEIKVKTVKSYQSIGPLDYYIEFDSQLCHSFSRSVLESCGCTIGIEPVIPNN